jgi:hypothetical protein
MALTEEQLKILSDLVDIRIRYLSLRLDGKARALVTWSINGIADLPDYSGIPTHVVDVKEGGTSIPDFPKTYVNAEAYDEKYSIIIEEWDIYRSHTVDVIINEDFEKTRTVKKVLKVIPEETTQFSLETVTADVVNVNGGLSIQVKNCHPDMRKNVRNVTIEKSIAGNPTAMAFTSSIPYLFKLSNEPTDYSYAIHKGKKTEDVSTAIPAIYDFRRDGLFKVEYLYNSGDNFVEELDEDVILDWNSEKVEELAEISDLNVSVYNDPAFLYKVIDSDGLGTTKYYRYLINISMVPSQSVVSEPNLLTPFIDLSLLDYDFDGSFNLWIDGTPSKQGDSKIKITSSLRTTKKDQTSFTTVPHVSILDLNDPTILNAGVTFMDGFFNHVDKDVSAGTWYTYRIKVTDWEGVEIVVFSGDVLYQEGVQTDVPENITLENLSLGEDLSDNILVEEDFQSGVSHTGLRVWLSSDRDDINLYTNIKEAIKTCQC